MQSVGIISKRVRQFIGRVVATRYTDSEALTVHVTTEREPIPFKDLERRSWQRIEPGTRWGELFDSAWFRMQGSVPDRFAGKHVVALVDVGGEACLFENGSPTLGLTDKPHAPGLPSGKRRVPPTGNVHQMVLCHGCKMPMR